MASLLKHIPKTKNPELEELLEGFLDYSQELDLALYPAQEEAILELLSGHNVILNTPTGSGKSMVALAAHYRAIATGLRSVYTAPIKALVSEKFFALRQELGLDQVGMVTGDGAINPEAPVICCTAEILANRALREGANSDIDVVIADEFHYYSDPQRGWAWQVPILEMANCQFLLMSATLGDTTFFEHELTTRNGRHTVLISSDQRPVPLGFEYRDTTLHQSVSELLESDMAPIYLVHFTQREASEAAQGFLSLNPCDKSEKARIQAAIGRFSFDTPVGKEIRRYITAGVGVHHAGMLPKYRLLVEKLAQDGLLKVICGTDTLGVGVNVPIRTVLFTQLCKYDGQGSRILSVREFQQIAGRAGRKGFDEVGHVWAQAPRHVVENEIAAAKAAEANRTRKRPVKKKPPQKGYVHWNKETFSKLANGRPEPLRSSFKVNHQMVLTMLDRPGDGCRQLKDLLQNNHEPRKRKRLHQRRSIAIYRSLMEADLLEHLDQPDEQGRKVRINFDLQDEFALHQPLSLWAIEAIEAMPPDQANHTLIVVSIIESIMESPAVVMIAQLRKAKDELMVELKEAGVEYEERMERLNNVEIPKPNREFIYNSFNNFRAQHPWVGQDNVLPKSIVREMYEQAMTFRDYINHYGLSRSEGVLLRYMTDVYKGLVQNIPTETKTQDLSETIEWLGELIRQVDSSLIDEWQHLAQDPPAKTSTSNDQPQAITANSKAFRVMVRNEMFRWVEALANKRYERLPVPSQAEDEIRPYWQEFDRIEIDGDARSSQWFEYNYDNGQVTQILCDPQESYGWRISGLVDLNQSAEQGKAVIKWQRAYQL